MNTNGLPSTTRPDEPLHQRSRAKQCTPSLQQTVLQRTRMFPDQNGQELTQCAPIELHTHTEQLSDSQRTTVVQHNDSVVLSTGGHDVSSEDRTMPSNSGYKQTVQPRFSTSRNTVHWGTPQAWGRGGGVTTHLSQSAHSHRVQSGPVQHSRNVPPNHLNVNQTAVNTQKNSAGAHYVVQQMGEYYKGLGNSVDRMTSSQAQSDVITISPHAIESYKRLCESRNSKRKLHYALQCKSKKLVASVMDLSVKKRKLQPSVNNEDSCKTRKVDVSSYRTDEHCEALDLRIK